MNRKTWLIILSRLPMPAHASLICPTKYRSCLLCFPQKERFKRTASSLEPIVEGQQAVPLNKIYIGNVYYAVRVQNFTEV